ncbi:conjugative transposon protein TraK [Sphingobacterium sp. HJSM2_6]|uniref:conjugative transposon protein TraK n=1 Tax=Sphingobacterium sp. HJSM2_6 TaxID=3366264 RepID=UPI003BDC4C9E
MFGSIKNLDRAFRHVRMFSLITVCGSLLLSVFAIHKSFRAVNGLQERIYVLSQGKVMEAYASNRRDNLSSECRNHVETFHQLFFSLVPDEKANRKHIRKALYLADQSAQRVYSDLMEGGFYSGLITGNVSQTLEADSVLLSIEYRSMRFRFFGKQIITRSSSIVTRSLITEGSLREIARSDQNPHGLLIEGWKTLENKELSKEKRN